MNLPGRARAALARRVRRSVVRGLVRHPELGLEKIGTDYGGWIVPTRRIDASWRCYCGGVGEDASFDLGLVERFGCEVVAIDPTPRAIAYAEPIAKREPRFRFLPIGLWSSDTSLRFYKPRNDAHVSHSVVNLQGTSDWFEAPVRTIGSVMADLGDRTIDLLKLDIEGAEHAVLGSVLGAGVRPRVLCFEVDQPVGPLRLWRTMRRVRAAGYTLVAVDGWNFTFVLDRELERGPEAAASAVVHGAEPRITFVTGQRVTEAPAADLVFPIGAGTERAVAATKTVALTMLAGALLVARLAGDGELATALQRVPTRLERAGACDWSAWSDSLGEAAAAFVAGRGYSFGSAREIALKLTETLRLPALGYSTAELRHGPRAAITPATPVLVLRQGDETAATADQLVRDLRGAGGTVFVAGGPHASLPWLEDDHPVSDPIAMLVPAYRAIEASARRAGLDPDHPPFLNKVTSTL